ncbi:hypothetical protein AFLA_005638 [Aspergillus flavus NRRL3357]|nr:hypothetical protein AFLA_005638 [Aspergillus flavus NRRL3357]
MNIILDNLDDPEDGAFLTDPFFATRSRALARLLIPTVLQPATASGATCQGTGIHLPLLSVPAEGFRRKQETTKKNGLD